MKASSPKKKPAPKPRRATVRFLVFAPVLAVIAAAALDHDTRAQWVAGVLLVAHVVRRVAW